MIGTKQQTVFVQLQIFEWGSINIGFGVIILEKTLSEHLMNSVDGMLPIYAAYSAGKNCTVLPISVQ